MVLVLFLFSCKKEYTTIPNPPPPPEPVSKVLLKDITMAHLPSPYYHFEYNQDSTVSKVNFASGYTNYDVLYDGGRIGEMRNNILVNHDTLRYFYDPSGKLLAIKFINDANVTYRHVIFSFNGNQVNEIQWDQRVDDGGFLIDRTLALTYYPDGNLKTMIEHRPSIGGSPEITDTVLFEQYDDKINVEDFSLIHDGIHDHLFLLQGFRLQRNNPGKESFFGGVGLISYTVNYTYTYNSDHTPSSKSGDFLYTAGPDSGKRFQTSEFYTYY